jgi:hypothetical protein
MFRELDVGQSALLTDLAMCINYYRLFSPGLYCCVHATVQLDDSTRFCPGIVVQVNHGPLKQCDPGPSYDCFKGPPNFVLDVFPEDDLLDYEHRRECFERARISPNMRRAARKEVVCGAASQSSAGGPENERLMKSTFAPDTKSRVARF